ncbi:MAG: end-binding protein Ku [Nocardioidaceae bacterium]|nr:end-binding protein Ku [Nocardioidaceae bacterium]
MRAIWKGAVSFGLVSVPVKLYAATESHDISFRQVHAKDGGRIKYQRVCSIDGEEVAYADIAKGYETEDGQMVILEDEDLAELPASSSREISVEKFVPRDQIDPMWLEKSYYLEPDKAAAKPYALLREALKEADRVAVVTVSIRTRMTTAVLRVRDDVIVMQTMLWPDEVRKPDFAGLNATDQTKPQELKMARLLVDTLAGDYDPDDYEDDYQRAVEALVQAKLEGGEVTAPEEPKKATGEVVDLLAALQRSVDAAKSSRGEGSAAGGSAASDGSSADADDDDDDDAADRPAAKRSGSGAKKTTAKTSTTGRSSKSATSGSSKSDSGRSTSKKAAAKKPAAKKTAKKAVAKKAS